MSAVSALKAEARFVASPAPRRDLRTGVTAAGWVDAAGLESRMWAEALAAARSAWAMRQGHQPLSAPAPSFLFEAGAASELDALLRGAGFAMRSVTIEIDEIALKSAGEAGFAAIERLRARGWGVAMACGAECIMPMGERLRRALTEIIVESPERLSPDMALDEAREPILRRVRAANNADLIVTALNVKSPAHAGMLVALGFDRGAY